MADQVKELYKGEILFGNYVDGTQTLYTTDSTKTAVIKDAEVGSTGYTVSPTLQVNDFQVANLGSSCTGSEIVGINTTVKIKNNESTSNFKMLSPKYVLNVTTTTDFYGASNPSAIFSPSSTAISITKGTATAISSFSSSTKFAYEISGNIYYFDWDNNSSTSFYYRNIASGATTTINTTNYSPVCFDGVSKFYWCNPSSQIRCFDTATMSTSTIASGLTSAGTTYPVLWLANNILFWKYTYSVNGIFYYNLTNGSNGNFVDGGSWYSSQIGYTVAFYDSSTNSYRLCTNGGTFETSTLYIDLTSNSTGTAFTKTTSGTITTTKAFRWVQTVPAGLYNYYFGSYSDATNNFIYRMDKNGSVLAVAQITDQTFGNYTLGSLTATTPTNSEFNTSGPKINLRITGVESTL